MARGDPGAAAAVLESAFAWHDGLPIPFEFGRTQLVAGEVHRRCRRRKLAAEQLRGALGTFDLLGAALWSRRAATELAAASPGCPRRGQPSPGTRREACRSPRPHDRSAPPTRTR